CRAGDCVYQPLSETVCDDGDTCTTGDTCQAGACLGDPMVCAEPPAATCAGDDIVSFASPGLCSDGQCAYGSTTATCPLGCEAGSCKGDPCAGVVCDVPLSACHLNVGVCQGGACNYALDNGAQCDDGDACTQGDTCQTGQCAGTTTACAAPPVATCTDASTLQSYDGIGTCAAGGACEYTARTVACADGCQDGACLGNPCEGVICDNAPSGCFESTGTCDGGVCQYAYDNGASCDDSDACSDADVCTNGVCSGTGRVCQNAPAAVCADPATLRTFANAGTCDASGGSVLCDYATTDVPCGFGCEDGGCLGDPCSGVVCNTPPLAVCSGVNTLNTYADDGTCTDGGCSYGATATPCQNGCADGACLPPTGVVISEIVYDSSGFPDTDSFIELHGVPGTALDGVTLVGVNGNGGSEYGTIALSGTLDQAGFYLVAHPGGATTLTDLADLLDDAVDFQNGADSVHLRFGALVLDAIAYGSFDPDEVMAGEGEPHPGHSVGESLTRDAAFADTDNNLVDFVARAPSPAEAPITCEDQCEPEGSKQCDGGAIVTCGDGDDDGCNEWIDPAQCSDGNICQDGNCACPNPCDTDGATECVDGEVRTCSMVGSCLNWSATTTCDTGACADAAACAVIPDLVISSSQTLCGVHVVDEFVVQGGAVVTCETGELRVQARTIMVDPASIIDVSQTSEEVSGGQGNLCSDSQLNYGATGAGGGGGGVSGHRPAAVRWEKEVRISGCTGGWWCYNRTCVMCSAPAGGGDRGAGFDLSVPKGGSGGEGCQSAGTTGGSYSYRCYPDIPRPRGGLGGGAIELVATESITILGKVLANGGPGRLNMNGDSSPVSGSGGGGGGTIALRAPTVTVDVNAEVDARPGSGMYRPERAFGCGNEDPSGADGATGLVKIVYSDAYTFAPTVEATVIASRTPPTALSVTIDGAPSSGAPTVVTDTFEAITFSWENPYDGTNGAWYRLGRDRAGEVTAGNAVYTTEQSVTFDRAAFTAGGQWYFHVVSVHGADNTLGALSNSVRVYLEDRPVSIGSTSHPDSDVWTAGLTLAASWSAPTSSSAVTADFAKAWYRLDRNSQAAFGDGVGWTEAVGPNLILSADAAGQLLTGFAYYLHIALEDDYGNVGTGIGHYRVLIGTAPERTNFFGYVKDAQGDPLVDAQLRFEPFYVRHTTVSAGYFILEDLYEGTYTVFVDHASGSFEVTGVVVDSAVSPTTLQAP
ncbi:MAG: hypothetical protein ACI9MR_002861, partial [Myxococcota bacterium]